MHDIPMHICMHWDTFTFHMKFQIPLTETAVSVNLHHRLFHNVANSVEETRHREELCILCVITTEIYSSCQETEKFILEGMTPAGQIYKVVLVGSYLQKVLV